MNLTSTAIDKRAVTYFVAFLILVGGIGSFFALGQLEDPNNALASNWSMRAINANAPDVIASSTVSQSTSTSAIPCCFSPHSA